LERAIAQPSNKYQATNKTQATMIMPRDFSSMPAQAFWKEFKKNEKPTGLDPLTMSMTTFAFDSSIHTMSCSLPHIHNHTVKAKMY
jgi:hypothetical protein